MEPQTSNSAQSNSSPASNSSKNLVYLLLAIFIVLVLGVVWIVTSNKPKTTNIISSLTKIKPAVVSITSTGFMPTTISVKVNQAVEWTNNSSANHIIATDPYPTDNGVTGFKSGLINLSDTYSFVFPKAGTYTYHDDLNPYKFKGVVVVKN